MAVDLDLVLYGLVVVTMVLYVFLIEGYRRNKLASKTSRALTLQEAFALFEKTYKSVFPQDRSFTWGEAAARASGVVRLTEYEWQGVQRSVRQYEAYRYGEIAAQDVDAQAILKLTLALRKKS
jgi:hypothetical protein